MFIETYFDERAASSSSSSEPVIPYPELVGEEFMLWQRYLPVRTELRSMPFRLYDDMPRLVIAELEKAQKAPHFFERIEIWSRSGDPMAVGVTGGEQTRYFSIARWGDARLTLDQVKKRLRLEKWMFRLAPLAMILMFLIVTLVLITHAGQFSELAQKASYQGELFGY